MNSRSLPIHLLVLESDEGLCRVLQMVLPENFLITFMATPADAISYMGTGPRIDLLLTSFYTEGMVDGLDVVNALRSKSPNVPVILMTGRTTAVPRIKAILSLPNTWFLRKPCDLGALMTALESALAIAFPRSS